MFVNALGIPPALHQSLPEGDHVLGRHQVDQQIPLQFAAAVCELRYSDLRRMRLGIAQAGEKSYLVQDSFFTPYRPVKGFIS